MFMNLCLLMSSVPGNTWNDVSVTEEQLRTDHGGAVRMSVHVPSGGGRLPAIVVAPGRGYHRGLPIPVRLCELAAERGLVAVRYYAVKDASSNVSVLVVPGDHGLEVADALTSDGSPQNRDNIEAAMRVLVEWARSAARGGRPVTS